MTAKVSVAMFGSSLVSAYWNGAATYYRGIVRALDECGFDVTFYEPDAYSRQQHRDMADPSWARVVVYPATQEGLQRSLDQARDADILIKASGVGVFDTELEAEIPRLRNGSNMIVFWDVDAPATLERMHTHANDPFRTQVGKYDLVLDREARVHEFFLKPAVLLPEKKFVFGGSGWDRDVALTPNINYVGHVYTRDHNAFNCSTLAVLCDRARRRLLSEHTYQHRAQELRELLVDRISVGALGARQGEEEHRAAL